jgi:hypothetical protein
VPLYSRLSLPTRVLSQRYRRMSVISLAICSTLPWSKRLVNAPGVPMKVIAVRLGTWMCDAKVDMGKAIFIGRLSAQAVALSRESTGALISCCALEYPALAR